MIYILIGIALIYAALLIYFSYRNKWVYEERMRVLDLLHNLSMYDIKNGNFNLNRYKVYEQVSYSDMLYSFNPVRSFFKDAPELMKGFK